MLLMITKPALAFRVTLPPVVRRSLDYFQTHVPSTNFITLHYVYFTSVCLFSAIIFWGSSTPARSVSFTDSIFFTVSAMTLAGLNTINLSQLNTFQQFLLFLLILLGSAIFVSVAVVHVRKKAFERRFSDVIERERQSRKAAKAPEPWRFPLSISRRRQTIEIQPSPKVDGVVVRGPPIPKDLVGEQSPINPGDFPRVDIIPMLPLNTELNPQTGTNGANGADDTIPGSILSSSLELTAVSSKIRFKEPTPYSPRVHKRRLSLSGVGARPESLTHTRNAQVHKLPLSLSSIIDEQGNLRRTQKYFQSGGFIGRNSQFHSLTVSEREKLGGVEYRAIRLLEAVIVLYFVLFQLLGCIGLGAWLAVNQADTSLQNGLNPWFVMTQTINLHFTYI